MMDFKKLALEQIKKSIKPVRGLGKFEDLAVQLSAITHQLKPSISKACLLLFAADHGIANRGVSLLNPDFTSELLKKISTGNATINLFCEHFDVDLKVIDVGTRFNGLLPLNIIDKRISKGTKDFLEVPCMTLQEYNKAINIGINSVNQAKKEGYEIIGIGEIGIGNTTIASALTAATLKLDVELVVSRGTGIDDKTLELKKAIVRQCLSKYTDILNDPPKCLQSFGGFEVVAMVGATATCIKHKIPLVLDGVTTSIAAYMSCIMEGLSTDSLFFSHLSREIAHPYILSAVGKKPLIDLEMALGEGTGSVIGISLLKLSSKILSHI